MNMRTWTALITCTAAFGCFAQQATWNIQAQFRNPLWSDSRVTDFSSEFYSNHEPNSTKLGSVAFGVIAEHRFVSGCAIRLGFEQARNAQDHDTRFTQTVPVNWFNSNTTNVDIHTTFRQQVNTLSAGATHYMTMGRMEAYFGGEAILRVMDDLEQDIKTVESDPESGTMVYAATERVRFSGGRQIGIAPIVGFQYRVCGDFFLGAEFAPTWAWGDYGKTRTVTSVQELPDANTYVGATQFGGQTGGPFFLPRFGAGISYRFGRTVETSPVSALPPTEGIPAQ